MIMIAAIFISSLLCSPLTLALSTGYTPPTYRSATRRAAAALSVGAAANNDSDDKMICSSSSLIGASMPRKEATRRTALQHLLALSTSTTLSLATTSAASATTTTAAAVLSTPPQLRATTWPLGKVAFSLLPLAGTFTRRATTKETLVDDGKNGIWTFDQVQGVVNVNVPVRMTVIKVCN